MASMMTADIDILQWSHKQWWFDVATNKWRSKSKQHKINLCDLSKLVHNKSPLWSNCYDNPTVLKIVLDHCITELNRLIPKIENARKNKK